MTPREEWREALDRWLVMRPLAGGGLCGGFCGKLWPVHESYRWRAVLRAWERVDAAARGWRATLRVRREQRALRRELRGAPWERVSEEAGRE